jgi:hypothetical protein
MMIFVIQVAGSVGGDAEGKSQDESKGKKSMRKSKGSLGSLGMITGKVGETEKTSAATVNGGVLSQRFVYSFPLYPEFCVFLSF